MKELADEHCVSYGRGSPCLTAKEATALRTQLHEDWELGDDCKSVHRVFKFKDYYRTISFVNALACIANLEDHHPELAIGYDCCRVTFKTHSVGGLSKNDFICGAKVDRLVI